MKPTNALRGILLALVAWLAAPKASEAIVIYEFKMTSSRLLGDVYGTAVLTDAALGQGYAKGDFFMGGGALDGLISIGIAGAGFPGYGITFDFALTQEFLTGSIFLVGGAGDTIVSGSLNDFNYGSDGVEACWGGEISGVCGATGVWVRVPEPATLALLGAGLMGLAALRQRSQ